MASQKSYEIDLSEYGVEGSQKVVPSEKEGMNWKYTSGRKHTHHFETKKQVKDHFKRVYGSEK